MEEWRLTDSEIVRKDLRKRSHLCHSKILRSGGTGWTWKQRDRALQAVRRGCRSAHVGVTFLSSAHLLHDSVCLFVLVRLQQNLGVEERCGCEGWVGFSASRTTAQCAIIVAAQKVCFRKQHLTIEQARHLLRHDLEQFPLITQ